MADFSLGEAIGLQGRFGIAEGVAQAGINATNARIKAAQAAAKADEEAFNKAVKNLTFDTSKLNPLFVKPAANLVVEANNRLAEARANGDKTAMLGIQNDFIQDSEELRLRSMQWDQWMKNYDNPTFYKTREQTRLHDFATTSNDYLQLGERLTAAGGSELYDPENHLFAGNAAAFSPRIDLDKEIERNMSQIKPTTAPPLKSGDITTYHEYVFSTIAEAEAYKREQNLTETPASIEQEAINMLTLNPSFFNQYSDEQGTTDINELVRRIHATGAKYAEDQIKLKEKSGINISMYTAPEGSAAQPNLTGNREVVGNTSVMGNLGKNHIPLVEIQSLAPTANTINKAGTIQTQAIANAKPQSVVILPYKTVTQNGVAHDIPLYTPAGSPDYNKLKLDGSVKFQVYTEFTTSNGVFYVPADEFSTVSYYTGNDDYRNQVMKTLQLAGEQSDKLNAYQKANKSNPNNDLYKYYNAYMLSPAGPAKDALFNFLKTL